MIDMNLSTEWVPALGEVGVEAIHWSHVGDEASSDEEIVAWAQKNDAIILTRDLDFGAIVTMLGLRSPSVVQIRIKQVDHVAQAGRLKRILTLQSERLAIGAIVTVESDRVRVRRLQPFDPLQNETE